MGHTDDQVRFATTHVRPLLLIIIATALAAILVGACTNGSTASDTEAVLTVAVSVTGHQLELSGTTSLPDGTKLNVVIENPAQTLGPSSTAIDEPGFAYAQATVAGGAYRVAVDVGSLASGACVGNIGYVVDDSQPAALLASFGADGSRLVGPDVRRNDDGDVTQSSSFSFTIP